MPLTDDGAAVSQIFGGLLIRPVLSSRTIEQDSILDFSMPPGATISGADSRRAGPSSRDYR
jgi:hypothetical protein